MGHGLFMPGPPSPHVGWQETHTHTHLWCGRGPLDDPDRKNQPQQPHPNHAQHDGEHPRFVSVRLLQPEGHPDRGVSIAPETVKKTLYYFSLPNLIRLTCFRLWLVEQNRKWLRVLSCFYMLHWSRIFTIPKWTYRFPRLEIFNDSLPLYVTKW